MLIATAVAAALSYLPAASQAQSASEFVQIREQLQSLMQRVDKLEQENSSLKEQNENLKSQTDYLKAETKGLRKDAATTSADVAKVKGADWAGKLAITGDVRYRYEGISDETLNAAGVQNTADRYRDRIRARLNATVKATDTITAGIGFSTTEGGTDASTGGDPRSGNQTLTNVFSRKSIYLDTAYVDWKFAGWGDLIAGKMKQPFWKPGQSLFWDNDVNPEGLAFNFNQGMFFGTAYYYWLSEISGNESTITSDIQLVGAQAGVKLPFGSSNFVIAAHYYDLRGGQDRSPFWVASPTALVPVPAGAANNNTTVNVVTGTAPNTVTRAILVNDYNVAELSTEFNTTIGELPLQAWAQVAKNDDPDDFDTAWAAGVLFGKASNYRTWEFGVAYESLEKDALFGQLIDSDFAGGVTDSEGWIFRAGYAPVKNWTLNATYFLTQRNVDVGTTPVAGELQSDIDYDRLQVDFNVKF
ncbi:MAG: putative porin [Steroidobacteraceae bacterium]